MIVGEHDVQVLRRVRQAIERDRGGARPDVARELSIAVTAIEDAEMRLTRALVRQSRHKADAESAVDKLADDLVDVGTPAIVSIDLGDGGVLPVVLTADDPDKQEVADAGN